MNGREMFTQTTNDKTDPRTQATQPNKQMVKVQADARCPSSKKQLKQQRQQRQRQRRLKNDSIFNESLEKLNSFSLSIMSEASQTEYVRRPQNSTKEILKIGRRKVHVLSNRGIEWSLRAFASMRAMRLFLRARAVINFLMRAASTSQIFRQLESLFIRTLFCALFSG